MDDALSSVRLVLEGQAAGFAHNAVRHRVRAGAAVLNISAGGWETAAPDAHGGWLGAKLSIAAGGFKKPLQLLFDGDGTLRCVLVANRLGQLRTGAATGISAEVLAHPDAKVVACLGAGFQAWTQIEALTRVRSITRVHLWNRSRGPAEDLAGRLRAELGLGVEVFASSAAAVAEANVVITVTASPTPVLLGRDVRHGTHVVLAGSNHPGRREADGELFGIARAVYADDLAQARNNSGDLIMAVAEGALAWDDVDLLAHAVASARGNTSPGVAEGGVTIFCSQGVGSWDVALASVAYERALSRSAGTEMSFADRL